MTNYDTNNAGMTIELNAGSENFAEKHNVANLQCRSWNIIVHRIS
jgi:hypothetical protein